MPTATRHLQLNIPTQKLSLKQLVSMCERSMQEEVVRKAAINLISGCSRARDPAADLAELRAIYHGVRDGDPRVEGLDQGLRYVPDPRGSDYFVAPHMLLKWCADGSCGEDCDSHGMLIAALCGAIGFHVGLRAWGNLSKTGFQHVYAVVHFPKREPFKGEVALDTTVATAEVGWKPPTGRIITEWIPQ
ncbi:MAG: hypothetical protein KA310_03430 [Pseudomonadales bacterium]|nr:hypothetical protein [Pseudomonadales bacterium]